VPADALVEITTRTIQGRLLLKPSPELTEIILGIIGKAQDLYEMSIHAFVVISNHAHFLLSPSPRGRCQSFHERWGGLRRRTARLWADGPVKDLENAHRGTGGHPRTRCHVVVP
jgi:REP element-mobilizing transposase RayT